MTAKSDFVVRLRSTTRFEVIETRPLSAADRAAGVVRDVIVRLGWRSDQATSLPPLRLVEVAYIDRHGQPARMLLLTNLLEVDAGLIGLIYQYRWQVELFFKWIKQHLRIKTFYGTSENAVKTQIWTAITVYVLVAVIRKRLNLQMSLYTILQILSVTLFERMPILQALSTVPHIDQNTDSYKQPNLFD